MSQKKLLFFPRLPSTIHCNGLSRNSLVLLRGSDSDDKTRSFPLIEGSGKAREDTPFFSSQCRSAEHSSLLAGAGGASEGAGGTKLVSAVADLKDGLWPELTS